MKTSTGHIKPFIANNLPKTRYTDVNELARDIASSLAINQDLIVVNLINLPDLKGEKGDRGKTGEKGNQGDKGDTGQQGPAGPGLEWSGDWVVDTEYLPNTVVVLGNVLYVSTVAHTSTSETEPGTGASWETVWGEMITLPASYTSLTTSEPNGGTPVAFKLGGYTESLGITADGYVIIDIDGVKYKLLAIPV